MIFYSLGLYLSGSMGDHFNPKKLIMVNYTIITLMMLAIGYGGYIRIANPWYYYACFAINGLMQSVGYPTCLTIVCHWFGKRGRGKISGLWCAGASTGNVIGALLTSLFTSTFGLQWYLAYSVMAGFIFLLAILNALFLVPHPEDVNVHVEEIDEVQHENEQILLNSTLGNSINIPANESTPL